MAIRSDLEFVSTLLPFYRNLSEPLRRELDGACVSAAYVPGEIIINRERDQGCNGLVLVKEGQLRAYYGAEDGKEITLYHLLPGEICILSASCVLKNIDFEVTLEVEKASEVVFIPASTWSRLLEGSAEAREFSMELLNERFSEVMWIMEQMVSRNMGQRVSAFLLEEAAREGSDTLALTHDAIAKNLGTAREVVSRILKYLENDGLLRLSRGQVVLKDVKRLREMSR